MIAGAVSPPVTVHTLLTGWQTGTLRLVALALELALVLWYVVAVRSLAARGRVWSRARTGCFLAGMAVVVVAVQSGLAAYGADEFWVYVLQHLLLMNIAPVLLALAAPMTLALQASGRSVQRTLLAVLHNPVVELITNPILVSAAAYGTMLVYFLSPFYNFTLEHPLILDLTLLHFFLSGYLFWWLVVGRDPSRWRLSYPVKLGMLAAGIPVNAILGVTLSEASASIAPHFNSLGDTKTGGSVLWVMGELLSLVAMGIILYQWMQFEEREAVRVDRREDRRDATAPAIFSPERNGAGVDARDS